MPYRVGASIPLLPTLALKKGHEADMKRTLIIACGAVASELLAVIRANRLTHIDVTCLPASWHMTPSRIPGGMRQKIRENRGTYDEILCLYGDCGTGGKLDEVLEEEGVVRIEGDHCYAFFAGVEQFKVWQAEEGGTFYLTDFLVRHFDQFIIRNLGLDLYPELLPDYFGNFTRVLYLAQIPDVALEQAARLAAQRLGLSFEMQITGLRGIDGFLARSVPIVSAR
jgi:Protein of unknown function (DUF1638)